MAFRSLRFALLLTTICALLLACDLRRAQADEIAPDLETLALKQKARGELKRLVAGLDAGDQRRLTGLYLAFDPDPNDPIAMVACDDDGDFVIVLSEAMLRFVANVARAQSYDDASGSRRIEEYAEFLARSQLQGRRLLPPPPGFYTAQNSGSGYDDHLQEAVSFVIARELTHLRAGDLVCAHPTATREHGDDEWTASERRRAFEATASVYPGRPTERDSEAIVRVLDAGRSDAGARGFLRAFAHLELERATHASPFAPTYMTQHPSATTRLAAIRVAADQHRKSE